MKIAAFTMAHNEAVNLPLWIKHYGDQFGVEHVYVIDDGSTDGSTEGLACDVIRLPRTPYSPGRQTVRNVAFQRFLLHSYDMTIYADTDEFLVPDPDKYQNLKDYCLQMSRAYVRAFGFDVVHHIFEEPAIDLSRPILGQRKYWRYAQAMCKPLLTRVPLHWTGGCHNAEEEVELDPDLYLFHLKQMDYNLYCERVRYLRSMDWHEDAIKNNAAYHSRVSDQEIDTRFRKCLDTYVEEFDRGQYSVFSEGSLRNGPLMKIPQRFYGIL